MKSKDYDMTLWVRVYDPERLFRAALAHRAETEAAAGFHPEDPAAHWGDEYRNEDGTVDINACLVELIDPGVPPDGCEILSSGATRPEGSDDDDEQED